jgi:hypothetical protein
MSDLPKNIAIPHRTAHRNYNSKKGLQKGQKDISLASGIMPKTTVQKRGNGRSSGSDAPGQNLKQTDLVEFNQAAEKVAVQFLAEHIRRKGSPSFNTACALIALELDISTETAKRYLRKYSVDHPKAPFAIENGFVMLRRMTR